MKVGITYDLKSEYLKDGYSLAQVAELDEIDTINKIENALKQLGYETERVGNSKQLIKAIIDGKHWDIVWNICEGIEGFAREAQAPMILDLYKIPYVFSDPYTLMISLDKSLAKQIIQNHQIPTAEYKLVKDNNDLDDITLEYPLFVKPVAEGSGKGVKSTSKVNNLKELKEITNELIVEFKQPVLVEKYLPGREFTVGIIGNGEKSRVIGVCELIFKNNFQFYEHSLKSNFSSYQDFIDYSVPEKELTEKISKIALSSWKALGGRDCGRMDLRLDKDGIPNFLELNPIPGLNNDSDLPLLCRLFGHSYIDLIGFIIEAALERNKLKFD